MSKFIVRRAHIKDAPRLKFLLHEWLNWEPPSGRVQSVKRAIKNEEFLVAQAGPTVVGFIHFILHEDVVDGAPNAFITAFYVQERFRGKGIGTKLLHRAIIESASRGATFVETSTLHSKAKAFYEERGFRQFSDDIGEVHLELDVNKVLEVR
jgi:GNAT superfamily N-acetyltransferase